MILEGDPKEMICQAVEQNHVDLLVVGSRGLGMIKRLQPFILFKWETFLVNGVEHLFDLGDIHAGPL